MQPSKGRKPGKNGRQTDDECFGEGVFVGANDAMFGCFYERGCECQYLVFSGLGFFCDLSH